MSSMEALYGDKPIRACHRCGNCILWAQDQTDKDLGVCEIGSPEVPNLAFRGTAVTSDAGAWVTMADAYCDSQVPIPPPGPPCPKCGAPTYEGFGLAGGGFGAYELCTADGCDHFQKWPIADDDE